MNMLTVIKQPEGIKYIGFQCRSCGDRVRMETGIEYKLTDDRCEACKQKPGTV